MRSRSIVVKLWLAFTALILVVMVPLGFALERLLTDFYSHQVTEPLLYHSHQLAALVGRNPETIQSAAIMGKMVGGEVIILGPAGDLVPFPDSSQFIPPREAVLQTLSGSVFVGQATDPDGRSFIIAGVPVPGNGGAVLLLAPAEPVRHSLILARRYLWLAGGGTLLLGTVLALLLSRHLLRPVIAIEQATRSIAKGDLSTRVDVSSGDELEVLAGAVNQMTEQLQAFETRRREFLANVAHELRTPLSYIRGYTQALREGLATTDDERERYQRIVHEESARIGRLVDDLMDLAQIEEGQMAMTRTPLDLRIPIEQAVATVRPRAEEKGIALSISLPQDLPPILADGGRIQQVVFNLLDNSLRHTPEHGAVHLTAAQEGESISVSICDNGPGVEPELLPLVFERFHKGHGAGRGLGLAIVRSIVRAHGGEVGVSSTCGSGTTFWFRLPVRSA